MAGWTKHSGGRATRNWGEPVAGLRPGYLRVDTVHQCDLDGTKVVYHINAVDEVTQWEVVGAAAALQRRRGDHGVLSAALQSLPELPSAVRRARAGGEPEGQGEEDLPRSGSSGASKE